MITTVSGQPQHGGASLGSISRFRPSGLRPHHLEPTFQAFYHQSIMSVVRAALAPIAPITKLALEPVVTAALLFAFSKGPDALRNALLKPLLLAGVEPNMGKIVNTLKVLLTLGVVGKVSRFLNGAAVNNWRFTSQEQKRWDWNKEVAVVTGGCSGIGLRVVRGLLAKGVKVAILDIQPLPEQLEGYANVAHYTCDITSAEAIQAAAAAITSTFGAPSILINNAGIGGKHSILDTPPAFLQKILSIHLAAQWLTAQAFLPAMVAANKGHVVTVASMASFVSCAGFVDYCVTKAGLLAYHEGLTQELKHVYRAPNVLTTVVHPHWVRTPLVTPDTEERIRRHQGGRPLLEPQAVADAVLAQIFACQGGQLFMPSAMSAVSGIRGWPFWLQEKIRDSTAGIGAA